MASPLAMLARMATVTECYQICLAIITRLAAKLLMMNVQVRHGAARLTAPSVSAKDLLPKTFICGGIKPQGDDFWTNPIHDAFSPRFSRNACFWSSGRNL
jgi:hypothetical protein